MLGPDQQRPPADTMCPHFADHQSGLSLTDEQLRQKLRAQLTTSVDDAPPQFSHGYEFPEFHLRSYSDDQAASWLLRTRPTRQGFHALGPPHDAPRGAFLCSPPPPFKADTSLSAWALSSCHSIRPSRMTVFVSRACYLSHVLAQGPTSGGMSEGAWVTGVRQTTHSCELSRSRFARRLRKSTKRACCTEMWRCETCLCGTLHWKEPPPAQNGAYKSR